MLLPSLFKDQELITFVTSWVPITLGVLNSQLRPVMPPKSNNRTNQSVQMTNLKLSDSIARTKANRPIRIGTVLLTLNQLTEL